MNLIEELTFTLSGAVIFFLVPCCDSNDVATQAIQDANSSTSPALPASLSPRQNSSTGDAHAGNGSKNDVRADQSLNLEMSCTSFGYCQSAFGEQFICLHYGRFCGLPSEEREYCDCQGFDLDSSINCAALSVGQTCPCTMVNAENRIFHKYVNDFDGVCRLYFGEFCYNTDLRRHTDCHIGGPHGRLKCEIFPNQREWVVCVVAGSIRHFGERILICFYILVTCLCPVRNDMIVIIVKEAGLKTTQMT